MGSKNTCKYLNNISIRNKTNSDMRPKSFKFLNEFVPKAKKYLTPEHMEHLMGMTEVEAPIPPQMPKLIPKKIIQEYPPQIVEYQQTFPENSILCTDEPRFVELV